MKAVIHIGTPKSGSTTIQAFLALNRDALERQGFRQAPMQPNTIAQMELGLAGLVRAGGRLTVPNRLHALGLRAGDDQEALVARFEAMLREAVRHAPDDTYIASAEQVHAWLSTADKVAALDYLLRGHFEQVRYVVYYRPQAEFMLSTFSERIKRGERVTFEQHFAERLHRMDFHRRAQMWASVVGHRNLSVRLVDGGVLVNADLLDDFCAVAGIQRAGLQTPPRMNVSLTVEEIALYRRLGRVLAARRAHGGPNPVFRAALALAHRALPSPGTRLALTPAQRAQVIAANADSNERLRAQFFPDRATLFSSP